MIRNTISCDHCDIIITENDSPPVRICKVRVELTLLSYGEKADDDNHTKGEYHLCKACVHKLKDLIAFLVSGVD